MIDGTSMGKPSEPRSASVPATSVAMAAPSSTHGIIASLEVESLGDELSMVGCIAERHLRRLGALEIEMHVVLPRETDAAVHLDAVAGDLAIRVGHISLGHRRGERSVRGVRVDRPRGVIGG